MKRMIVKATARDVRLRTAEQCDRVLHPRISSAVAEIRQRLLVAMLEAW
jgi:hypothetical protein